MLARMRALRLAVERTLPRGAAFDAMLAWWWLCDWYGVSVLLENEFALCVG